MHLTGSRTCRNLTYTLSLASPSNARTSICHCCNCKKAFGANYGLTAKVPVSSLAYTAESEVPIEHVADNGSGRWSIGSFAGSVGALFWSIG